MTMSKYAVEFFWSDEDEGFIATVPDLPGCSAFGETRQDAAEEVEHAIDAWISAAEAAGNPIPEPCVRDDFETYSGKILLRMPKELHRDLQVCAKQQGVSLNSYVCYKLSQRHYHAEAIKDLASSLRWHSIGFKSGATTQHLIQLSSVVNEPSQIHGSTASTQEAIVTPLARFGVTHNA